MWVCTIVCLNFMPHSFWGCSSVAKSVTYKFIVWQALEYGAQVRNLHTAKKITVLESVNQQATHGLQMVDGILSSIEGLNHLINVFPAYTLVVC